LKQFVLAKSLVTDTVTVMQPNLA